MSKKIIECIEKHLDEKTEQIEKNKQMLSESMINEIEFHLKCVRNDVIDCEDFVTAIEQISAHYYAMNVELKN